MVVASMANGFLMPRYGLIPVWYIGGSCLALIGAALMCESFFDSVSHDGLPSAVRVQLKFEVGPVPNMHYRHRKRDYIEFENLRLQYTCRHRRRLLHRSRVRHRPITGSDPRNRQCRGSHDDLYVPDLCSLHHA